MIFNQTTASPPNSVEDRLRIAINAVKFGVWDWDLTQNSLVWDPFMYHLFEISPNDFSGDYDAFSRSLLSEDAQRVQKELATVFQSQSSEFKSEFRILTKKGEIKYIAATGSCFYNENGQIQRLIGCNWDLTPQRLAEKAAHAASEKIRTFFNLSVDLLGIANFDGYFKQVNPSFLKKFGLSETEATTRPFLDFIDLDDRESAEKILEKLKNGNTVTHFEFRAKKSESEFSLLSLSAVPNVSEKLIYAVIRDLTDIKIKEEQLIQSSNMASLGEMASGFAHEINNPLAIIKSRAAFTLKTLDNSQFDITKMKEGLTTISRTVDRIAKIVKGLQLLSRDTTHETIEPYSVIQIIDESLSLCKERFQNNQITIKKELIQEASVFCRHIQIEQVLLNLLNNAFDALQNKSEKWVKIATVNTPQSIQIRVSNSGGPIPKSIQDKIMQPFFTTKPVGKGTGLGLSISKALIEQQGGLFFLDKLATHTTFIIELKKDEK